MREIAFYYEETGKYAPKEGLPYVRRENVAVILKYEEEYLLLSWNEVDYEHSLVTGGIEDGEDKITAVTRETIEETGYYDIKDIQKVDCVNISKFYVEHKNQNREAVYYPYLVELASLDKKRIDYNETREHTCIWVKIDDLDKTKIFANHRRMLECALDRK